MALLSRLSGAIPQVLRKWGGPVLLVGISYDEKTKRHEAHIERV